ncbi:Similar to hypothetical protein TRIVIDRAFT_122435, partial [Trichoderma virens Gv29-8]; acc. no. EHK19922 [Pyronema omphalodes CBS 100304]|uniref:Uncharacterized protein n=1 Tax=Pyronema omphalodes (strain CBS 100304) TaxID=1076935 RepID=U4KWH5_PYROM
MTALYSSGDEALVDIIAVTGLAGHAYGSWKAPGGNTIWLKDLLPQDVPRSRIFTY